MLVMSMELTIFFLVDIGASEESHQSNIEYYVQLKFHLVSNPTVPIFLTCFQESLNTFYREIWTWLLDKSNLRLDNRNVKHMPVSKNDIQCWCFGDGHIYSGSSRASQVTIVYTLLFDRANRLCLIEDLFLWDKNDCEFNPCLVGR